MNETDLSLWQHLCLRLFGNVEVGEVKQTYGHAKLYAFRCEIHGLQTDTPHGYGGYAYCEECEKQLKHNRVQVEAQR